MTVKEEAMGFKVFKINKYEPVEDERRLSEFAQKGEFIKFHFGGLAFFKKGEPKNMRYCIEASYLRAGGKKKRFYAENGWRLVCRGLDINIFSAEGNAVPLHTDRSEYAHIIKNFHKARIAEALILCIILLLSCAVPVIVMPMLTGEFVMMFARWGLYNFTASIFLMILIITLLYMAFFFRSLLDSFNAGKIIAGNIENGKSAEKAMRNNKLFAVIVGTVTVLAAVVNVFYGYCAAVSSEYKGEIEDIPSNAVFAEDVFPADRYILVKSEDDLEYIRPEKRTGKEKAVGNVVIGLTSAVTDEYYKYIQQGILLDEDGKYGDVTVLSAEYISFKTKPMARLAAMELIRNEETIFSRDKERVLLEQDTEGTPFDRIITLTCKNGGRDEHIISLQQGKNVYMVKIFTDSITTEELLRNIICAAQDYAA